MQHTERCHFTRHRPLVNGEIAKKSAISEMMIFSGSASALSVIRLVITFSGPLDGRQQPLAKG
jgi:hypothetical protein